LIVVKKSRATEVVKSSEEMVTNESKEMASTEQAVETPQAERDWKELPPGVSADDASDTETDEDHDEGDDNDKHDDDKVLSSPVCLAFSLLTSFPPPPLLCLSLSQGPFSPDLKYFGPDQISTASVATMTETSEVIRIIEISDEEVVHQSPYSLHSLPSKLAI
jgi:hypothetical protein